MSSQLGDSTAKCRPFYDIFDANRTFLCRNIVDYINALWFFAFLTLLLWSIGTPVGLNLISLQRSLTALGKAQALANERDARRSDSHHRPRERGSSATRERSTSSTARQRPPPLRRTATEETLDLPDDEVPRPAMQQRERDERSRERETSRSRGDDTAPTTPARSRGGRMQRNAGADDNWGSSGASRAPSHEREISQARTSSRPQQQQLRAISKPTLRRQGTEEFDLEADTGGWSRQQQEPQQSSYITSNHDDSGRREPIRRTANNTTTMAGRNKLKLRRNEMGNYERESRRSMTPILPVRPDAQPAIPMPKTPTRLRNRVSLTTRAVANIVRASHSRNKPLQRSGTEDYDLDDGEIYGANSAAVAAAQRTPPRTAPPPPPPPNHLNRFRQRY